MTWYLDNERPIWLQLMERIQRDIISGKYKPGGKLPSVRELAVEASVNPNTMQKALAELERRHLVFTQRTSGRFITEDEELLEKLRREEAYGYLREFITNMQALGYQKEEIQGLFEEAMKGGEDV